jgi:hypothetical protein
MIRVPVPSPCEEAEDACDLEQREDRRHPGRDGEGSVGPGEQETERGHDV